MYRIAIGLQILVLLILLAAVAGMLCPTRAVYICTALLAVSLIMPQRQI